MRRLKTCARWTAGPGLVAPVVRRGEAVLRLSRLTLPGAPFCDAVAMRRLKTCARWTTGPGLVAPVVRRGEAVLRLSRLTLPGARIRIGFLRTAKWDAVVG